MSPPSGCSSRTAATRIMGSASTLWTAEISRGVPTRMLPSDSVMSGRPVIERRA